MKIGIICNEYPPAPHGGIGISTRLLSRGLVEAGHHVRVIGLDSSDTSLPRVESDEGVKVWRLKTNRSRIGWILSRHLLYRTVAAWAQSGAIDILETPDYQGLAAAWPALRIPIVTRLHGSVSYFAAEMGKRPPRSSFLLERAALHRSNFLCSCSSYTAERTRKLFRLRQREITVLHNAVTASPKVHGASRDRESVIFTGTLTPKKGVISLFRAWPSVLSRHPQAHLQLFGKPGRTDSGQPMQEFLISVLPLSARHTVHFHGHVEPKRLRSAFQSAAASIFPSYSEAFALAPMEAMAEGCPTIYSRRASGPELIQHRQNGLLIDPDNPAEIADAISEFLRDPAFANSIGEAGRTHIERSFSLAALLPKNIDYFQQCLRVFRDHVGNTAIVGRRAA